jgi:hypothetical protein
LEPSAFITYISPFPSRTDSNAILLPAAGVVGIVGATQPINIAARSKKVMATMKSFDCLIPSTPKPIYVVLR